MIWLIGIYAIVALAVFIFMADHEELLSALAVALLWPVVLVLTLIELIVGIGSELWHKFFA